MDQAEPAHDLLNISNGNNCASVDGKSLSAIESSEDERQEGRHSRHRDAKLREDDEQQNNVGENQYASDPLPEPSSDTESDVNGDQYQRQTHNQADFLSQAHPALGRKRGPKADSNLAIVRTRVTTAPWE